MTKARVNHKKATVKGSNHVKIVQIDVQCDRQPDEMVANACKGLIDTKVFRSDEVKQEYVKFIRQIAQKLSQDKYSYFLQRAMFIMIPFEMAPKMTVSQELTSCVVDGLSVLKFIDNEVDVIETHVNTLLREKNWYGIYYCVGNNTLKENLVRFFRSIEQESVKLPPTFSLFFLNCQGDGQLEPENFKNWVRDIYAAEDDILKFPTQFTKCIHLTSSLISELESLATAAEYLEGLVNE